MVQVDRGGQVTYHGPGQLIVYLLLDLRRRKLGIRPLVSLMEGSIVELLQGMGLNPPRARTHRASMWTSVRLPRLVFGCAVAAVSMA